MLWLHYDIEFSAKHFEALYQTNSSVKAVQLGNHHMKLLLERIIDVLPFH